ncbi:hypothetical protein B0H13DRAFT_1867120 [Mycena leptocephala]|nr:hypothetical protein B0H13DRAFT_1867120 [Mycena leptocephala]
MFKIGRGSTGYLTVASLDLQLDWHIANSVKESTSSQGTSASGIPKAKSGANGRGSRDDRYGNLREAISRHAQILERVAAGLSSIVEEPAPEEVTSGQMEVDDGGSDSKPTVHQTKLLPLQSYETGHSNALCPIPREANKSFMGNHPVLLKPNADSDSNAEWKSFELISSSTPIGIVGVEAYTLIT